MKGKSAPASTYDVQYGLYVLFLLRCRTVLRGLRSLFQRFRSEVQQYLVFSLSLFEGHCYVDTDPTALPPPP